MDWAGARHTLHRSWGTAFMKEKQSRGKDNQDRTKLTVSHNGGRTWGATQKVGSKTGVDHYGAGRK